MSFDSKNLKEVLKKNHHQHVKPYAPQGMTKGVREIQRHSLLILSQYSLHSAFYYIHISSDPHQNPIVLSPFHRTHSESCPRSHKQQQLVVGQNQGSLTPSPLLLLLNYFFPRIVIALCPLEDYFTKAHEYKKITINANCQTEW